MASPLHAQRLTAFQPHPHIPTMTSPRQAIRRLALLALMAGFAPGIHAQDRGQAVSASTLDSIGRRIEFVSPRSGPPGTVVTLRTTNMPGATPVRIGVGAIRFGFEELAQTLTSNRGEIELTVEIPIWARNDLAHFFIVFDFYFVPIALSDAFHVTDQDGIIRREGTITDEGVECLALRGEDGVLYTLAGDVAELKAGDAVAVRGTLAETSFCMQGTTIQVQDITSRP